MGKIARIKGNDLYLAGELIEKSKDLTVLDNRLLHLDASSLSLADNDPVVLWSDLSGNRNATQITVANAPTYQDGFVRFNGIDQFMQMQGWKTINDTTMFFVLNPSTIIGNRYILGNSIVALFSGKANTYTINPYAWHGATKAMTANKLTVLTIRNSNITGSTQFRYDGEQVSEVLQVADSFGYGTGSTHILGKRVGSASSEFYGDIGEIIIYECALSDQQMMGVENYLLGKWFGSPSVRLRESGNIEAFEFIEGQKFSIGREFLSATKFIEDMNNIQNIPDMSLWLDASTIEATDGDNISQWNDLSGNDYQATQEVSDKQPKYSLNGYNGLPTVVFDGVDDVIITNAPFTSVTSIFIVYQRENTGTFLSGTSGGASALLQRVNQAWINASNLVIGMTQNFNDNSLFTQTYDYDLDIYKVYLDGDFVGQHSQTTTLPGGNFVFGARAVSMEYYKGNISEIIVYNRLLSDSERRLVEQYLMDKWGISQ